MLNFKNLIGLLALFFVFIVHGLLKLTLPRRLKKKWPQNTSTWNKFQGQDKINNVCFIEQYGPRNAFWPVGWKEKTATVFWLVWMGKICGSVIFKSRQLQFEKSNNVLRDYHYTID